MIIAYVASYCQEGDPHDKYPMHVHLTFIGKTTHHATLAAKEYNLKATLSDKALNALGQANKSHVDERLGMAIPFMMLREDDASDVKSEVPSLGKLKGINLNLEEDQTYS